MNKDILICGVGGQGTVLASKIIAASAMDEGSAVHSAETIGMAQRGVSDKPCAYRRSLCTVNSAWSGRYDTGI